MRLATIQQSAGRRLPRSSHKWPPKVLWKPHSLSFPLAFPWLSLVSWFVSWLSLAPFPQPPLSIKPDPCQQLQPRAGRKGWPFRGVPENLLGKPPSKFAHPPGRVLRNLFRGLKTFVGSASFGSETRTRAEREMLIKKKKEPQLYM